MLKGFRGDCDAFRRDGAKKESEIKLFNDGF